MKRLFPRFGDEDTDVRPGNRVTGETKTGLDIIFGKTGPVRRPDFQVPGNNLYPAFTAGTAPSANCRKIDPCGTQNTEQITVLGGVKGDTVLFPLRNNGNDHGLLQKNAARIG
jgi:hypothetical protein